MQKRSYDHTKAINLAKMRENYKCEICGNDKNIQGHHMEDYGFDGEADPDKIFVVCKECHDKIHNGIIKIKAFDFRE